MEEREIRTGLSPYIQCFYVQWIRFDDILTVKETRERDYQGYAKAA